MTGKQAGHHHAAGVRQGGSLQRCGHRDHQRQHDGFAGVSVRAQTSLGATAGSGTVSGTAQYAATGTTDSTGTVTLQLLPGSTYTIAATPAAGSPYASTSAYRASRRLGRQHE